MVYLCFIVSDLQLTHFRVQMYEKKVGYANLGGEKAIINSINNKIGTINNKPCSDYLIFVQHLCWPLMIYVSLINN